PCQPCQAQYLSGRRGVALPCLRAARMSLVLHPEKLTRESFGPFGDVIEAGGREHFTINQGFAERFNNLARIDTASEGGETTISIVRGAPLPLPIALKLVERHPLGSQIFFPLQDEHWLI